MLIAIVLVQKKNGTLRFCVDYHKLNAVTRNDAYPLPCVDDTLDKLVDAHFVHHARSHQWVLAG